jgi:hypothetical protein
MTNEPLQQVQPVLGLHRLTLEQRQSLLDTLRGRNLDQSDQYIEGEPIPPYQRIYEYVQNGHAIERERPEIGGLREAEIHATMQGVDGGDGWRVALSADHTSAGLIEDHRRAADDRTAELPIEQQLALLSTPRSPSPPVEIPASVQALVFDAATVANGHASWGGHPVLLVYCNGREMHDVLEVARWEIGPHGALGWSGGPAGAPLNTPPGRPRIDNAPEGQEYIAKRDHIATATVTLRPDKSALYAVSCNQCTLQMPPVAHEKLTATIQKTREQLPRYRDVLIISLYQLSAIVGNLKY